MPHRLLFLVMLVAPVASFAGPPRSIELFCLGEPTGLDSPPSRSMTITVYRLDALPLLEAALSLDLPHDREAATRVLADRLSPEIQQRLAVAWGARLKAAQYGIQRLPAAVIDRDPSQIVEGSCDLPSIFERASR